MNGPHDVGGVMGFGPVEPEIDEPAFHGRWEERVLGLTLTAGALGHWNLDESRHAREDRHPADYYQSTYYEIWLKGLERLLVRHRLVTTDELASGASAGPGPGGERVLPADRVRRMLFSGGPVDRPPTSEPGFVVGQTVRTLNINPRGHTRLPRYTRGKLGVVESVNGFHIFPDAHAHGQGEQPQWLYTVRFEGTELWGPDGEPGLTVSINAWESYLEPA
jgi:nitrile hydratase